MTGAEFATRDGEAPVALRASILFALNEQLNSVVWARGYINMSRVRVSSGKDLVTQPRGSRSAAARSEYHRHERAFAVRLAGKGLSERNE